VLAAADEKLVDSLLRWNLAERLVRVDDGQRHKNGARPRGNFVDVEVEPIWKKDDLRRNGRHGVVIVLPETAQIHLGKCVAGHYSAVRQDPVAAPLQPRIRLRNSHKLGGKVAFDGK